MRAGRAFALAVFLCGLAGHALASPVSAARARDAALNDSTAYDLLRSLVTEVGPRPVGSPAAARARDWAVRELDRLGFSRVHVETFPKRAWVRDAESAEVIAPFPQKLAVIGLGHSVPTPGEGLTAEVVVLPSLAALEAAPANAFAGKIVLVNQPMTRTQGIAGYANALAVRYAVSEAARRGAIAYLVRSLSTGTGRAPHTGVTQYAADGPRIPAGALGVPDADILAAMAEKGPVRMHLTLLSHESDGEAYTVSGEIPGSAPDETIVIGGHLDSWDPGSGAIDDGAGVAITMAAAHLVARADPTPRRTIRVVLWGSEEQGGSGAAYFAAHKDELPHIVAASESDLGADSIYQLRLPAGAWDAPDIAPLKTLLAPLKVIAAQQSADFGGEDIQQLVDAGAPLFVLDQDANRYFDYHHSADDTLAIIDPVQLRQCVAAWAATLDMLADSTVDLRKTK